MAKKGDYVLFLNTDGSIVDDKNVVHIVKSELRSLCNMVICPDQDKFTTTQPKTRMGAKLILCEKCEATKKKTKKAPAKRKK